MFTSAIYILHILNLILDISSALMNFMKRFRRNLYSEVRLHEIVT